MRITVRPGQVYVLPIPGDNGETKDRFCVVLDSYPTPSSAQVVSFIFGCSLTKRGAPLGTFVRVEREPNAQFRSLGLTVATTFHQEDIRHYDAWSAKFVRHSGFCAPGLMNELRKLSVARDRQPEPIPLLPDKAREDAKKSSQAWQRMGQEEAPLSAANNDKMAAALAPEEDPEQ